MARTETKPDAKSKLLAAAFTVVRAKGYAATSVDDLCAAAGVTKGAFFHHFKSKEELAVAAANHWSQVTGALFLQAPYHAHTDPADRVLAYVAFRKELLQGELRDFTCLVGTLVQEAYDSSPAIREACGRCIVDHAATLEPDIDAALRARGMTPQWSAKSLALHTQAVVQGSFILAKATGSADVAADSLDHLHRYLDGLFRPTDHTPVSKPNTQEQTNDRPRQLSVVRSRRSSQSR